MRQAHSLEYHDVQGVDHGYNIMSDATDITRRMYDLIVDHVRRAVSRRTGGCGNTPTLMCF